MRVQAIKKTQQVMLLAFLQSMKIPGIPGA